MGLWRSLSGRLLILTIGVVMLAEVAIFVPSVARYREAYLMERVRRAEIAALTVLAAPDRMVDRTLETKLIDRAEVLSVVVRREGARQMVLRPDEHPPVATTYDLRDPKTLDLIWHGLAQLLDPDDGAIRILAHAPADMGKELEVTLESAPLARAMRGYALNILWLSLGISLVTAVVVFVCARLALVRPVQELIDNAQHFSENPEDPERIIHPKTRLREIGEAERALADMQRDVHAAFKARARLAALGEAVAKISHDLRNILGTTQLMADRLETSRDPIVARTAPKLIASLDRAIRLCQSTLTYGRAEEAPPEPRSIALAHLAEEVIEGLGLMPGEPLVTALVDIDPDLVVEADPEQLYRVLNNLARNAVQAIRGQGRPGRLTIAADAADDPAQARAGAVEIRIIDTGPGLPARAREHLFKPFRGGTRRDGTGLGLAIAHELVRANDGELRLVASTTAGTEFAIVLPGQAAVAAA